LPIVVTNSPPTVVLKGPAKAVRGQTLVFSGAYTDLGKLDTHEVSWDFGDGTPATPFHSATDAGALVASHLFADAGIFTVMLSVRDDDGAVTTATREVTILAVDLQPDPLDPTTLVLVIGGTIGDDNINVIPHGSRGEVVVLIDGVRYGPFVPTVSTIHFIGQGGNDRLHIAPSTGMIFEESSGQVKPKRRVASRSPLLVETPSLTQILLP
jgi:PKD repeat protein